MLCDIDPIPTFGTMSDMICRVYRINWPVGKSLWLGTERCEGQGGV